MNILKYSNLSDQVIESFRNSYLKLLEKYLGHELFIVDDIKSLDPFTRSILFILIMNYRLAYNEIKNCDDLKELGSIFIKYNSKMREILKNYVQVYCCEYNIKFEDNDNGLYSINGTVIDIYSGIDSVYNSLNSNTKVINKVISKFKRAFKK